MWPGEPNFELSRWRCSPTAYPSTWPSSQCRLGITCANDIRLESDPRFFRQDAHRSKLPNHGDDCIEECSDLRRLAIEMMFQIEWATGVRLVAVREFAPALSTPPQCPLFHVGRIGARVIG